MTIEVFKAPTDGAGLRIAIAQARFNEPVCNALRDACVAELRELGVEDEDIFVLTVPGALEIPLALAGMARTGQFDALVAIGAVVRGETYHFEVVSNESAAGVMRVSLDHGVPVANAILTTENDEQAEDRAVAKGRDAARVAVEMANLHASLESMSVEEEEDEDADEDADDEGARS